MGRPEKPPHKTTFATWEKGLGPKGIYIYIYILMNPHVADRPEIWFELNIQCLPEVEPGHGLERSPGLSFADLSPTPRMGLCFVCLTGSKERGTFGFLPSLSRASEKSSPFAGVSRFFPLKQRPLGPGAFSFPALWFGARFGGEMEGLPTPPQ